MPCRVEAHQRGVPERVGQPAFWSRRQTSRRRKRSSPTQAKIRRTTRASSGTTSNRAIPPPRSRGDVLVPVGSPGEGADRSDVRGMAVPPFQDLRALVLGDGTLDLEQQVVLGAGSDRAIEKADLHAGPRNSSTSSA